jgi:Fe-S cluster biogenesis protein NfuA
VLEEIRPYLVGAAGGSLELVSIEEPIAKVRITGPAAGVMTVRVAVTQKLREKSQPSQPFNSCKILNW